ncbi:MAG TPA: hypothetical protein VFG89_06450 [Coriobacteriia bacterium]|nr:hypothetical protein [Coriobacteriia bacterium]
MKRAILVALALVLVLAAAGCMDSPTNASKTHTDKARGDSAGRSLDAARAVMKKTDPDAVPLSVSTQGVELQLPPDNWSVMFYSKAKGHIYRVTVNHEEPGSAEDMGAVSLTDEQLADQANYNSLKFGSTDAFEQARSGLSEAGGKPTQTALMSLNLCKLPTSQSEPGQWTVVFTNGTSMDGARTVVVDALSGEVTVKE